MAAAAAAAVASAVMMMMARFAKTLISEVECQRRIFNRIKCPHNKSSGIIWCGTCEKLDDIVCGNDIFIWNYFAKFPFEWVPFSFRFFLIWFGWANRLWIRSILQFYEIVRQKCINDRTRSISNACRNCAASEIFSSRFATKWNRIF